MGKSTKEEKNLMFTSLSQIPTINNNLIICCLTPMNIYLKVSTNQNFWEFLRKKSKDSKCFLNFKLKINNFIF